MMRAAVTQICSTPSITRNAAICCRLIEKASQAGAAFVSLPEGADFLARGPDVFNLTHSVEASQFIQDLRKAADKNNVFVECGVHEPSEEPNKIRNSHILISPEGQIVSNYSKTHLFDVDLGNGKAIRESDRTAKGDRIGPPVQTNIGQVGLLTCYDLRFAEAAISLRNQGAQVITYPSAFTPATGRAHWEVLLRARAIETQCYIIASAQAGEHYPTEADDQGKVLPGRSSHGDACIVDPWGTVVARCSDAAGDQQEGQFVIADINLDWLEACRKAIPVFSQRRNDLYPVIP